MTPRVFLLDFESRSRADLKACGGRLYWEHPSTEALCVVYGWSDEPPEALDVWFPGDPPPPPVLDPAVLLGAHNAMGFDRFGAARVWGEACAPFARWVDTSELARRAGLPGALDALAGTKDKEGSRLTKSLSSSKRPTKADAKRRGVAEIPASEWRTFTKAQKRERGLLPEVTPAILDRVVRYCASDVAILLEHWPRLAEWLDIEPDVSRVDRIVNDRGIAFDSTLARRLLILDRLNGEARIAELAADLGVEPAELRAVASSPAQFVEATGLPDATATTVEDALAGKLFELEPGVREVCLARQATASIARGKLLAGLARVSPDGRIRDSHRYIGAHTWRWSGRGMQLQNMPRPAKRFEGLTAEELDRLAAHVLAGGTADADTVALLLRATLTAGPGMTLADADFAGVEARVLAHLAGDELTLRTIREGLDPYKIDASAIFGVPYEEITKPQRQAGKVATLACGYGGGAGAIVRFAAANRVDLAAAGVEPQAIVDAWREAHAPVVQYWRLVEDAMRAAVEYDEPGSVGDVRFAPAADGTGDVAIVLPSGRPIVYPATRATPGKWGRSDLSYRSDRGRTKIYGGLLVENVIQAICRDLLADALVRAEDEGLRPVLHVHDQIVCEVPEADGERALERLIAIMRDVPPWAAGYPIDADGHVGRRHRK